MITSSSGETTRDARAGNATDTVRRIRAIVASASGNLVEWYDFYVYSFTALYFAGQFFPGEDRTGQLLNAAGVFAAGFLTGQTHEISGISAQGTVSEKVVPGWPGPMDLRLMIFPLDRPLR